MVCSLEGSGSLLLVEDQHCMLKKREGKCSRTPSFEALSLEGGNRFCLPIARNSVDTHAHSHRCSQRRYLVLLAHL
jgi:hypothetical protein